MAREPAGMKKRKLGPGARGKISNMVDDMMMSPRFKSKDKSKAFGIATKTVKAAGKAY